MNEIPQSSINESVIIKDGNVLTSSLSVAYVFGKPHRSIMRDIDRILRGAEHNSPHPHEKFKVFNSTYVHPQNQQEYRKILMNRRVFLFLVMGFRGNKAFIFKNMFIDAFNNMEYQLKHLKPPMNKLNERNQKLLQNKVDSLEPENHQLKHKQWYIDQAVQSIKPKADAYDQEMRSRNVYPISYLAEKYGTDAMTMNLVLNKMGIIKKVGGKWYLTKEYADRDYACHNINSLDEHGQGTNSSALKWSQAGMNFIREMLKLKYQVTELHQMYKNFNDKFMLFQQNHKLKVTEITATQLNLLRRRGYKK